MTSSFEDQDRVEDVTFSRDEMTVVLIDGRKITVPLWWYPPLLQATPEQRANWQPCANRRGIHWPDIDEDLDVKGFLIGAKAPNAKEPVPAE